MAEYPDLRGGSIKTDLFIERVPLDKIERKMLLSLRNKRVSFILVTYLTLIVLLIIALLFGQARSYRYSEETVARYQVVAPIVCSFLFIVLTIYFVRYYLQSAHPLSRDLKGGAKELIYFTPEPYKTPFFEQYYVRTVDPKRKMIRIAKELYESMHPASQACISISPHARFLFALRIDNTVIPYNMTNGVAD